jgi:cytochrome c oxidase assembly protein Cox11
MSLRANSHMLRKLLVVAAGMFAFGYALVPLYQTICEVTGINILALGEREMPGTGSAKAKLPANTQVDATRTITVEFDANSRGPWEFRPAQRSVQVHPGEVTTVMYEFQNVQNRTISTNWNVSVSTSTRWHRARKKSGRSFSWSIPSCPKTSPPSPCPTPFLRWGAKHRLLPPRNRN